MALQNMFEMPPNFVYVFIAWYHNKRNMCYPSVICDETWYSEIGGQFQQQNKCTPATKALIYSKQWIYH